MTISLWLSVLLIFSAVCLGQTGQGGTLFADEIRALTETKVTIFNLAATQLNAPASSANQVDFNRPDQLKISASAISLSGSVASLDGSTGVTLASGASVTLSADGAALLSGNTIVVGSTQETVVSSDLGSINVMAGQKVSVLGTAVDLELGFGGLNAHSAGDLNVDSNGDLQISSSVISLTGWFDTLLQSANGDVVLFSSNDIEVSALSVSILGVSTLDLFGTTIAVRAANDISFAVNTATVNSGAGLFLVSEANDLQLRSFGDLDIISGDVISFVSEQNQLSLISDSGDITFVTDVFFVESFNEGISLNANSATLQANEIQIGIREDLDIITTSSFSASYSTFNIISSLFSVESASISVAAGQTLSLVSNSNSVYFKSTHEHTGTIQISSSTYSVATNQFDINGAGVTFTSTGSTSIVGSTFVANANIAPQSWIAHSAGGQISYAVASDVSFTGGLISVSAPAVTLSSNSAFGIAANDGFITTPLWSVKATGAGSTINFLADRVQWTGSLSISASSTLNWAASQQGTGSLSGSTVSLISSGDTSIVGQAEITFEGLNSVSVSAASIQIPASSIVNVQGADLIHFQSDASISLTASSTQFATQSNGVEQTDSISFSAAGSLSLTGGSNTATLVLGDLSLTSSSGNDITFSINSLALRANDGYLVSFSAGTSIAFSATNQIDLNGGSTLIGGTGTLQFSSGNDITFTSGSEGTTFTALNDITVSSGGDLDLFAGQDILATASKTTVITAKTGSFDVTSSGNTSWKSLNGSLSFTGAAAGSFSINSNGNIDISSGNTINLSSSGTTNFNSQTGSTWNTNQFSVTSFGPATLSAGSNLLFNSESTGSWSSFNQQLTSTFTNFQGGDVTFTATEDFTLSSSSLLVVAKAAGLYGSEANSNYKGDGIYVTSSGLASIDSTSSTVEAGTILFQTQTTIIDSPIVVAAETLNLVSGDGWTVIESGGILSLVSDGTSTINSARDIEIKSAGASSLNNAQVFVSTQAGDISLLALSGCVRVNTSLAAGSDIIIQSTFAAGAPITVEADGLVYMHSISGALSLVSSGSTFSYNGIEGQSLTDRNGISLHTTDISGNIVLTATGTTTITNTARLTMHASGNFSGLFTGSSGAVFTGNDVTIGSADGYTGLRGNGGVSITSAGNTLIDSTGSGTLIAQDQIALTGSTVAFRSTGGSLNLLTALNNDIQFTASGDLLATAGGNGLTLTALRDITVGARAGSLSFTSGRGTTFDTQSGPISVQATTSGFFSASENINFLSGGDLSISTQGDFSVLTSDDIVVNSLLGNVSYVAVGTATLTAIESITLESEGRSLSKISNDHVTLQSATTMAITSNNQDVYLDAQSLLIGSVTRPIVTFNAGGSELVPGIITRASGSIELDTSNQLTVSSRQVIVEAAVKEQFSTFGPITLTATTSFNLQAPSGSLILQANQDVALIGASGVQLTSNGPTLIQATGTGTPTIDLSAVAAVSVSANDVELSAVTSISITSTVGATTVSGRRAINFVTDPTTTAPITITSLGTANLQSAIVSRYLTQGSSSNLQLSSTGAMSVSTAGLQSDITFLGTNVNFDATASVTLTGDKLRYSANSDTASSTIVISTTNPLQLSSSSTMNLSSSTKVSFLSTDTSLNAANTVLSARRSIALNSLTVQLTSPVISVSNTPGLGGVISLSAASIVQAAGNTATQQTFSAADNIDISATTIASSTFDTITFSTQGYQSGVSIQSTSVGFSFTSVLSMNSGVSGNQVDRANTAITTTTGAISISSTAITTTSTGLTSINTQGLELSSGTVSLLATGNSEEYGMVGIGASATVSLNTKSTLNVQAGTDLQLSASSIDLSAKNIQLSTFSYNQAGISFVTPAAGSSIEVNSAVKTQLAANTNTRLVSGNVDLTGSTNAVSLSITTLTPFANDQDGIYLRAQSAIEVAQFNAGGTVAFSGSSIEMNGLGLVSVFAATSIDMTSVGTVAYTSQTLQTTFGGGDLSMTAKQASIVANRDFYLLSVDATAVGNINVQSVGPIRAEGSVAVLTSINQFSMLAVDGIDISSMQSITVNNNLNIASTDTGYVSIQSSGDLSLGITTNLDVVTGGSQFWSSQTSNWDVEASTVTQRTFDGSILYHSISPESECVFTDPLDDGCFDLTIDPFDDVFVTTVQRFVHIHHVLFGVLGATPVIQQLITLPGPCVGLSGHVCNCPVAVSTMNQITSALLGDIGYNLVALAP